MKSYLERNEVDHLIEAAGNLRDKLLITVLFRLGCRISEALAIAVQDIDLNHGTVTIQHLKTRVTLYCPECNRRLSRDAKFCPACGREVEQALAKERERRRQRVLPLDPETLKEIKEYVVKGGPVSRNGRELLFGINRHRAWQVVKDCAQKAGLPKLINPDTGKVHNISPHKLRDAFAVMAMKHNDSAEGLRLLQEHLGHQSFNTTARYRKVSGEEHREWFQQLWKRDQP